MASLNKMMQNLFNVKKWQDWDISIERQPERLKTKKLALPELIHKEGEGQQLFCTERLLKQMPIFNGADISKKHLIMIYSDNIRSDTVKNARSSLQKCQGQLKIKVDNI